MSSSLDAFREIIVPSASPQTKERFRILLEQYNEMLESRIASLKPLATDEHELRCHVEFDRHHQARIEYAAAAESLRTSRLAALAAPSEESTDGDSFTNTKEEVRKMFRAVRLYEARRKKESQRQRMRFIDETGNAAAVPRDDEASDSALVPNFSMLDTASIWNDSTADLAESTTHTHHTTFDTQSMRHASPKEKVRRIRERLQLERQNNAELRRTIGMELRRAHDVFFQEVIEHLGGNVRSGRADISPVSSPLYSYPSPAEAAASGMMCCWCGACIHVLKRLVERFVSLTKPSSKKVAAEAPADTPLLQAMQSQLNMERARQLQLGLDLEQLKEEEERLHLKLLSVAPTVNRSADDHDPMPSTFHPLPTFSDAVPIVVQCVLLQFAACQTEAQVALETARMEYFLSALSQLYELRAIIRTAKIVCGKSEPAEFSS